MSPPSNILPAFLAAAVAPAVVTGIIFVGAGEPAGFFTGLFFAFILAVLHVALLAMPTYALLSLQRTPGPALVLVASFLIGAVPLPLLLGFGGMWEGVALFGLLGLSGGIAFVLVSGPPSEDGEAG